MGEQPRTADSHAAIEPVPQDARPQRVIAVLGMHRSGTSALVGSLQQRGLFLGKHNTENLYNRRGNRENPRVTRLNEAVLRSSGGSWRKPPAAVAWAPEHVDKAQQIIAEHSDRPVWGFKDPRTLLTVEGWQRLVPDLEFVGIIRHPAAVARSLASRAELPVQDPLELWRAYNERLLALHRRSPFPVVSFDVETDVLEHDFDRVADALGLGSASAEERFFTEELRSRESAPDPLPGEVSALYEELRAIVSY